jgi:hypothetical protein
MIYLAVLKNNIDIFFNESIEKTNKVGYAINMDALLFARVLKGPYDVMKELVIGSKFVTDEIDFKKNVRVITEREEQLLPVLEQKSGKKLPLKLFYMHARLHERYIHLSLNQVVIEGQPTNANSKSITIKSKIITLDMSDLIYDNLFNAVQQSREYIVLEASCKIHNSKEDYPLDDNSLPPQAELSPVELDKIRKELSCFTKKVLNKFMFRINQTNFKLMMIDFFIIYYYSFC